MTTFLPAEVAQTLLKLTAGPDSVVVGGQAVSLWAAKFGLLRPDVALTRDLDLLSRKCAKVRAVLFLPRTVLLTEFVSDRRNFPGCDWSGSRRSAAVTGRTRHG